MIIGAYALVLPSGHFYIGQTGNWPKRVYHHRYYLERGTHHCRMLQKYFEHWEEVEIYEYPTSDIFAAEEKEKELISRNWGDPLMCNTADPSDPGRCYRGIPLGPEIGARISAAQMGRIVREETREKISSTLMGHIHSDETKSKIGKANSKKVEIDGVVYDNACIASSHLGVSNVTVAKRCRSLNPAFINWKFL